MTKQQAAAIKNILKRSSGKRAERPALQNCYTYDGEILFCTDGYRIVKSADFALDVSPFKIVDARNGGADGCADLRRLWEMMEKSYCTDAETITLPLPDELKTWKAKYVAVGKLHFNRKYLIDFVKVCRTATAEIFTRQDVWRGKTRFCGALKGTSPDGRVQTYLLPVVCVTE